MSPFAAVALVLGAPLFLAWLLGRQQKRLRGADIALARANATRLMVVESTLTEVHSLVNSNMSTALRNELDARVAQVATMREILDIKQAGGLAPSDEALDAIARADTAIRVLRAKVADRGDA